MCRRDDDKCVRYGNYNDVIAVKRANALHDEADHRRWRRRSSVFHVGIMSTLLFSRDGIREQGFA